MWETIPWLLRFQRSSACFESRLMMRFWCHDEGLCTFASTSRGVSEQDDCSPALAVVPIFEPTHQAQGPRNARQSRAATATDQTIEQSDHHSKYAAPSLLQDLTASMLPNYKLLTAPVHAPYHAAHLFSTQDIDLILETTPADYRHSRNPDLPIISSTTGKPSSVGASSGAAAAAAATYRKLALQPEAIPSLLSYMHATRNHCRQSIEQLEHINAGRGQSASLPFSKSTIAIGSVLPKSSATDQARGAEPLSLSSSRPPSSFRSPPSAITFDERSKSAAREAHNSVDSQTTIRGNKGIFSSFSAGDSAENMNFGSSVSMKTNTPFPMTSESVVSSPAQPPPLSTSPLAHTGTASSSDSSSLPTANTASPATKASSQPTTQHQRRPSLLPNRFSSSSSSKRRGE